MSDTRPSAAAVRAADIVDQQWSEGRPDRGGDGYWILLRTGWTVDGACAIHEDTRKKALSRITEAKFNPNER